MPPIRANMAYISLYRKYRPDSFAGMIGQKHIVRTLGNAVRNDTVSHAYLFTGTRGTGKTSSAKIFARAINCEHPLEDGSPCNQCATCRALLQPSNMDILEIDAASNNGVDEIRDLREKIKYPPTVGKYKVYIIDEVHMLTPSAFNALLKTLEEPPAHAVFILATTEVHKIPQTILSRCMRFDFRLLSVQELVGLLERILRAEGRSYQMDALRAIAQVGEGSVRDTLSICDMCVSYCEGEIRYNDVLEVLGASAPETVLALARAILRNDIKSALEQTDAVLALGKSVEMLIRDLTRMMRNILYARNCKASETSGIPQEMYAAIAHLSNETTNDRLLRAIEILIAAETDMRYSTTPSVILEAAIVRAADVSVSLDTNGILLRLKEVEARVRQAASGKDNAKPFDLQKAWGHLLNELQWNPSMRAAYTYAASVMPEQLSMQDSTLVITVNKEGDASALQYYQKEYEKILLERYFDVTKLEIRVQQPDIVVKQGVETLKQMFGDQAVTIKENQKGE